MPLPARIASLAAALGAAALLALAPASAALDPALEISQYGHQSWSARDGDFRGSLNAVAQTLDGYLWLGSGFGLLRFDGLRFVPVSPPAGQIEMPEPPLTGLLGARDGSLWIGGRGLVRRLADGTWRHYPELDGYNVTAILETRDGALWVSALRRPRGRLCVFRGETAECFGDDGALGDWPRSLHQDAAGRIWLGTSGRLFRWSPGPPESFGGPLVQSSPTAIAEDAAGRLLVASGSALAMVEGGRLQPFPQPAGSPPLRPQALLRDRHGGLWIGTEGDGLVHFGAGGRRDHYRRADGLTADMVIALFEDREGNVWTVTVNGLDCFRQLAVPSLTSRQGLASDGVNAVLAARDGSLWVSTSNELQRLAEGGMRRFGAADGLPPANVLSLFEDRRGRIWVSTQAAGGGLFLFENDGFRRYRWPIYNVFQFAEDSGGDLWIATRERGLGRVSPEGVPVEDYPWSKFGDRAALSLLPDPRGGIWLGFLRGGLAYVVNGEIVESYDERSGLGAGLVRDLQFGPDGAVWAATQGGLSRVSGGHAATLGIAGGLPCETVHWMREAAGGLGEGKAVWLHTSCGLLRLAPADLAAWAAEPGRKVTPTLWLDHRDGVENIIYNTYYSPAVTSTADGLLPFATLGGLALFDPARLASQPLPPRAIVELVSADGIDYPVAAAVALPPLVRDLRFDYTAPALSRPDKVRFRYRLEGVDSDWQDAGNRRQAFYRDLPPGEYRFAVEATNESGAASEKAVWLAVTIAPAWYQTLPFRLTALLLLLGLGWAAYRRRLARVEARLAWQFEERLTERTRIANELHDTLLQGFISASMQLALAFARLPAELPEKKRLEQVLALVRRVIDEGRDAVRGLRSEAGEANDLDRALARIPGELGLDQEVAVATIAEGSLRQPHPLVRDEVYRIGREAVVNALRHAGAARVAVSLAYRPDGLHLEVTDDGGGIAPELLAGGRDGHFGLAGMRERAARLGGRCTITSSPGGGTRVTLFVPAAVAFRPHAVVSRGQPSKRH